MPALLLAGGLAVGIVAELADVLGAHSDDVLFSGQASVPTVVAEDSAWIVLGNRQGAYGIRTTLQIAFFGLRGSTEVHRASPWAAGGGNERPHQRL
jgi:hypothetical protein